MNLNSTPLSRTLCYLAVSLALFICAIWLLIAPDDFRIMAGVMVYLGLMVLTVPIADNLEAIKALVKPVNFLNIGKNDKNKL